MPPIELPRASFSRFQELALRLLDHRKTGTPSETFAHDVLATFHDICLREGLDRVLAELEQAHPGLDITDRAELSHHPALVQPLAAQLDAAKLDGGSPRNTKPVQVADALVAALGLTLTDEPDRTIAIDDGTRGQIITAIARVVDAELALPRMRDTIVAAARARMDAHYLPAFDKLAAQLDERGMKLVKQPKLPIDAVQAAQRALTDARHALFERVARTALDRAKEVLARDHADAAARIDEPITLRLTVRDVAIRRVADSNVSKTPEAVTASLFDSLWKLARLAWRDREIAAKPYSPSTTFAVGDVLEHPKFGRGKVVKSLGPRIDVEFPAGVHTLVHARGK